MCSYEDSLKYDCPFVLEEEKIISSIAKMELPWWNKYTLSIQEASDYFGIGYKKLAKFVDEHEDAEFILWNGSRAQIKRGLFEKYIDENLTAI